MQAKTLLYLSVIVVSVYSSGCANNSDSSNPGKGAESAKTQTVNADKPNSDYKPAFEGQTRIAAVKTVTPYKIEKLAETIGAPWAVVVMPDERLLITDKSGYMQIRNADGAFIKKITGFPAVDYEEQGGMLDVALDPDFAKNKTIYWTFSEKYGAGNLTAVAKGQLDEADSIIKNPVVIFRATPALDSKKHYGARLLFDKDGNLFVSAGERSILEGRAQAQLLTAGLGKVFKITKEGKPAPGNPFLNRKDAMPEIYSYGHRNPESMAINPVTGELWEAEFGPRGGDEINNIKPGKNYGWPVITYGIEYTGEKIGDSIQQKEGMEQPVYYWDPVLSPGGIVFYSSKAIPEWENNLFVCGLSSQRLDRLVIVNDKVVGEEALLTDKHERFRDVVFYKDMLYVITDSGILFRISKQ